VSNLQPPEKTKPHVPGTGRWGLAYVLCGAVVSEPPKNKKGLRAKNSEHMITKCPEKSKDFNGMMEWWKPEWWNDGILEEWGKKKTGDLSVMVLTQFHGAGRRHPPTPLRRGKGVRKTEERRLKSACSRTRKKR
jgi:hypothetical protein